MKEEYLSIESAKRLANYERLEKEVKSANEKALYYKSEWENVTRLCISKTREITQLKKEITILKKELKERN